MTLHILTVTAFVEKDFPDLPSNQQTNKPLSQQERGTGPLDIKQFYSDIAPPPHSPVLGHEKGTGSGPISQRKGRQV